MIAPPEFLPSTPVHLVFLHYDAAQAQQAFDLGSPGRNLPVDDAHQRGRGGLAHALFRGWMISHAKWVSGRL